MLYRDPEDPRRTESCPAPEYFVDLNLDQVLEGLGNLFHDYNLQYHFYRPLDNPEEIRYRQAILLDLAKPEILASIREFSAEFRAMRRSLGSLEKLYNQWHRDGWHLEAVARYCQAVDRLASGFRNMVLNSEGLRAFQEHLLDYASSEEFRSLVAQVTELRQSLAEIRFSVIIRNLTVKVKKYENEIDYSQEIVSIFERFRHGSEKSHLLKMPEPLGLNHVEAQILDRVAVLFPGIFGELKAFCTSHVRFADETLDQFDREIQFYIAYLDYIEPLRHKGLSFCLPDISLDRRDSEAQGLFDLALAKKLSGTSYNVVTNDFRLEGKERILVITGPNQGGKTTFARAFGQLHHLASIGLPVPGTRAQLQLFDSMHTHFEKEETIRSQRGKLHEELVRLHESLAHASSSSIFILNEIFTSTTVKDALFLSKKILARILEIGARTVCVTFLDELASMDDRVVSMVSMVDVRDPSIRTFRLEKKPADGLAYARSIAEKYELTYEQLKRRLADAGRMPFIVHDHEKTRGSVSGEVIS